MRVDAFIEAGNSHRRVPIGGRRRNNRVFAAMTFDCGLGGGQTVPVFVSGNVVGHPAPDGAPMKTVIAGVELEDVVQAVEDAADAGAPCPVHFHIGVPSDRFRLPTAVAPAGTASAGAEGPAGKAAIQVVDGAPFVRRTAARLPGPPRSLAETATAPLDFTADVLLDLLRTRHAEIRDVLSPGLSAISVGDCSIRELVAAWLTLRELPGVLPQEED